MVTESYSSTGEVPPKARRTRWLPSRSVSLRFSKFTAGSVFSTLLSQVTLTGLYWWAHSSATVASLVAFVVGAIPNFLINWKWTWRRQGRPALVRELVPYIAIIVGGGLAATGMTTLADHMLAPLVTDRGWRTITLDAAYLSSYAILFVVKFALLDKVFGSRKARVAAAGQGA